MYTLLVLGIIPGTDIQISFEIWLKMASLVAIVLSIYLTLHINRRHALEAVIVRTPLHAGQLHSRAY